MKSNTARGLLGGLGVVGLATAGTMWYQAQPTHVDLASALAAQGYVWAATVTTSTGPVNFAAALPDPNLPEYPRAHYDRYRVWHACSLGSPCSVGGCGGERLLGSWWAIEAVIKHSSNPLGIVNNTAYNPTFQDMVDVERLTTRGGNCDSGAFRAYFLPTARALGITEPDPPPPPTPTPTPPPPPTPTPTPPPPASGGWGSSVQQVPCPAGQAASSLCLDVRFTPGVLSTGRSTVTLN